MKTIKTLLFVVVIALFTVSCAASKHPRNGCALWYAYKAKSYYR